MRQLRISPKIAQAIEFAVNTAPKGLECRIERKPQANWFSFYFDDKIWFFIELGALNYIVCKRHEAMDLARDIAMMLHHPLIDPNDIEIRL